MDQSVRKTEIESESAKGEREKSEGAGAGDGGWGRRRREAREGGGETSGVRGKEGLKRQRCDVGRWRRDV